MLSLTSSMRQAVCRARSRWQSPWVAAASIATRRHNSTFELEHITDELRSQGNAPLTPEGAYSETGINYNEISLSEGPKPHFRRNKFFKPDELSYKSATKTKHIRKKPFCGPSRKESEQVDIFYQLGIDPLQEAMNSKLLSGFVTEMGKIKRRSDTNLTWRNQRRLGKAIRRAKMMGVIPVLSRRMLINN
ncbi:uncharacterized protein B0H18DRAFT_1112435 [Fomitopsis serialis]|uniref:uncharacterized protein n=1 Tax=Fomitopsis serialis TaxID=139415 RepID=UPI00200788E5|nr:uncharacterized protein B0H18DRAFT_1117368 [Neoantrodia serialis]XP_047901078.1 uncharacterized protein B0H18DRAFT_1112435 [Neoantrodia serialis]KAH9929844.1 hypothetical protein B0H18DRAFT_1117368 [Neoantrodia serialis]KAH9938259.1 hypothetical protein B0H18DRAFT_1112435 [Neoantrodia serialis]